MDNDKYELCNDCEHATWDCYEGYSPKECGLSFCREWFVDGCKKNCDPYYDKEEECWTCNSYKMQEEI